MTDLGAQIASAAADVPAQLDLVLREREHDEDRLADRRGGGARSQPGPDDAVRRHLDELDARREALLTAR